MTNAFVHDSAYLEAGVTLGSGVKVWHFCHVRAGSTLGDGVVLGKDVYVDQGVIIGSNSRIQNGVSVYNGIDVSDWCFIGPHVIFTNDVSPRAGNKNWTVIKTFIKSGASIGAGAIIRCGIQLGEFSMVGAGAIVTKDVPAFHLALGVPAKLEKMICACGQTQLALGSSREELVRDCCRLNLDNRTLNLAIDCAKI